MILLRSELIETPVIHPDDSDTLHFFMETITRLDPWQLIGRASDFDLLRMSGGLERDKSGWISQDIGFDWPSTTRDRNPKHNMTYLMNGWRLPDIYFPEECRLCGFVDIEPEHHVCSDRLELHLEEMRQLPFYP